MVLAARATVLEEPDPLLIRIGVRLDEIQLQLHPWEPGLLDDVTCAASSVVVPAVVEDIVSIPVLEMLSHLRL